MNDNEILSAKMTLDEGQGEAIEDLHEDKEKYFDPSDLDMVGNRSSYKKEKKALDKQFNEKRDFLEKKRDLELAALDGDTTRLGGVEEKYQKELAELEEAYQNAVKQLEEIHLYEITYRIHPRLKRKEELINSDVLLSVRNLKQFFFFGNRIFHRKLKAVSNVSFDVHKGECFGIVGESGCGKTTTGRTIIKLYKPTSGSIYYRGYRIGAGARWNQKEIKWTRKRFIIAVKKIFKSRKEEIAALDKNSPTYANDVAAIKQKYKEQLDKEISLMKSVWRTQRRKIKQIRFDQNHTP